MRVVRGRKSEAMDAEAFDSLLAGYERLIVDVGTGDGRYPYRLAAADPSALYVGCDPVAENMADVAARSRRKPARGGVANLLLVVAEVEQPPAELRGRAAEVWCVLPWGRLMEGLVVGDPTVLNGLRAFAQPGAPIRILLNAGVWDTSTPRHVEPLPEITDERIDGVLTPAYADAGIRVTSHGDAPSDRVRQLGSTWAGRLTHGGGGRFIEIDAVAA